MTLSPEQAELLVQSLESIQALHYSCLQHSLAKETRENLLCTGELIRTLISILQDAERKVVEIGG